MRELLPLEPAVAVPNELDGDSVDAGVTGLLARGKRRQFAIVRAREVLADIGDFSGDQMEVVEQPLRRGRNKLSGPHIVRQGAIGAAQDANVVLESRKNVPRAPARVGIDREAGGERQRSLFEPFDAQELVAQRLFGWRRAAVPESPSEGRRHGCRDVYMLAGTVAVDSLGSRQPSKVCFGEG